MFIQLVQFESSLDNKAIWDVAHEREPQYAAIPSLKQKYYLRLGKPNHYGGLMLWDSADAIAEFRETKLAQTVGEAYGVVGAPQVDVFPVEFALR